MTTGCRSWLIVGPIGAFVGAILILVTRSPIAVDAGQGLAVCTFPFHAQVYQGPNTGLVLHGNVTMSIEPSGNAFGILAEEDGTQVGLVGQVTGRSLSLLLAMGADHLSAIGIADNDVSRCGFTTVLGSLIGPAVDDSGSWGPSPPCLPYPACRSAGQ